MNSMKNFWSMMTFMVGILCVTLSACSSDDDVIPQISVPTGNENFFEKSMDLESSATEKSFTFTSNVAWTLNVANTRDGSSWLSATPTSGEAGTYTITVKASENTTYDDRNAVISIVAGDSIHKVFVNQKQLDALTVTSDRFEVPVEGGYINVEVKTNIDYEVIIPDDNKQWIHLSDEQQTRAISTSSLSFKIDKCEEYDKREGMIIIKAKEKEEVINVYQVGEGILTLTKNEYNLSSSAQELTIEIKSNFDYAVEFPDVDWIEEVTTQTRGISTHSLRLHVSENEAYESRTAKLRVYDRNSSVSEEVIINQSQKNELIIEKKEFEFDENGGSFSINVKSNVDYKVIIDDNWVKEETTPSTRSLIDNNHTFTVAKMGSDIERESKITFSDKKTGVSNEVVVKQKRLLFLESSSQTMMMNNDKLLKCTNLTNQKLKWTSSNPSVASVDENGKVTAISKGTTIITVSTIDDKHSYSCSITVKDITDFVSMARTGTSMSITMSGTRYSVTFTITNSSSETIHIVSLGGVKDGVTQDLKGGDSVSITLASSLSYIQSSLQTLVYTYKGKEFSHDG